MKKILIAYDGSEGADAALYDLRRAGMPEVARALVVSVAESWFPPPPPSSYQAVETLLSNDDLDADRATLTLKRREVMREAEALAGKAAKWIQTSFPHWDVQTEPLYGSPASELLVKSDRWEPDLIVTGSHGRSAIGRLILGSISQKVVNEAPCSVRIGRMANNRDPAVRIVVGVDGSNGAAQAARAAARREWPAGSEIRFVAVYDAVTPTMAGLLIPKIVHWVEAENRATIQLAFKMVESFEKQFRSNKLATSHLVVAGDPKKILVDEANRWAADCIFVGARGLSRINRFLLGSVSAAVAARANCSVEVTRTPEDAPELRETTDYADYA